MFIYTDNVFAKFHDTWSNVLHIKMDIPCSIPVQRDMLHIKHYSFSSEFVNTLLSEHREIMHHFETSEGFVTHAGWHQPFSQITTPGNYKCNCPSLSHILPSQ